MISNVVKCIVCGKEEPQKHPGHFMCGDPKCRDKIVSRMQGSFGQYHLILSDSEGVLIEGVTPRVGEHITLTKKYEKHDQPTKQYVVERVEHDLAVEDLPDEEGVRGRNSTTPSVYVKRIA